MIKTNGYDEPGSIFRTLVRIGMKVINKVAFLVHEPVMYAHYSSVWAEMERNSFVIVLLGVFSRERITESIAVKDFLNKIKSLDYEFTYLDDLVADKVKYQYVVSNHIMGGSSAQPEAWTRKVKRKVKNAIRRSLNLGLSAFGHEQKSFKLIARPIQYLPLQAGIRQIRFMYGADISDGWSLAEWNRIYDLYLCHGPNDETRLKERFKGKTVFMGYPRYDAYFSSSLDIDETIAEFGLDREKQTVLWMPTVDAYNENICSIPFFAESVSSLMGDFNVIVRPHPLSFTQDRAGIELLESLGFNIDRNTIRDMNPLYRIADVVLCDYGGSAFGALYLGKQLVFLETPSKRGVISNGSSTLELMRHFPTLKTADINNLRTLLNDKEYWQEQLARGRELSDVFFADYRGNSSEKTARILENIDSILD